MAKDFRIRLTGAIIYAVRCKQGVGEWSSITDYIFIDPKTLRISREPTGDQITAG